MKNTKVNKVLAVILAVVAMVSMFALGVCADDMLEDVKATINKQLTFKFNGEKWNPKEADGSEVKALMYNDRTYLPVRALSEKLGLNIEWDGERQCVVIDTAENTIQPVVTPEPVVEIETIVTPEPENGWQLLTKNDFVYSPKYVYTSKIEWVDHGDKLVTKDGVYRNGIYETGSFVSECGLKLDGKYTELRFKVYTSCDGADVIVSAPETRLQKATERVKALEEKEVVVNVTGVDTINLKVVNNDGVLDHVENKCFMLIGDIEAR